MAKQKSKLNKASGTTASTQHETVRCDFSFPRVLGDLRKLTIQEWASLKSARERIEQMTWQQVYDQASRTSGEKRGINGERIQGQTTRDGIPIHSIRIDARFRARVVRRDRNMRFISLHPDHDSAYAEVGGESVPN